MDLDAIFNAIIAQESGGRGQNPGQIQPGTWAQYSQPGEDINNREDNLRVAKRIVSDYHQRYAGDPQRIATAYFSGPGNVAPADSPTPYRQNRSDPSGKQTSSYVSDISRRLTTMPFDAEAAFSQYETAPAAKPAQSFDAERAFSQWEKSSAAAPIKTASSDSRPPIPTELMTPQQRAEEQAALKRGAEGQPSFFSQFHPISAIGQTYEASKGMAATGLADIARNLSATGVGETILGLGGMALSPITGPISEATRALGLTIGNPEAAERASLFVPEVGALRTAAAISPSVRAANEIVNLVGKENIPAVVSRLEQNPRLSLMDVSEPVRTVAAGQAANPEVPGAQNILKQAYQGRTGARTDIVKEAMDTTLGPAPDVKQTIEGLAKKAQEVGSKAIQPALKEAQPVGVMPIIQSLDKVIASEALAPATKSRLTQLRSQLAAKGEINFMSPDKLHGIQSRLREEAENLRTSSVGSERSQARDLFNVRENLVDAIDNAAQGKYRPALAQYRDAKQVQEAFDKGMSSLKVGGVEDFPEYWRAWAKDATPHELAAARLGALTAIRRTIEGFQGGARRGETVISPEFVRERFETLFGPERTQKFANLLADARDMSETNARLFQGSKTASTTAGIEALKLRDVGKTAAPGLTAGLAGTMLSLAGHPEVGALGLGMAGLHGAKVGGQLLGRISDKIRNVEFASLASATGPKRNQLLDLLRSAQEPIGGRNKLGNLAPSLLRLPLPH